MDRALPADSAEAPQSSAGGHRGPIRWLRIEAQPSAGDKRNFAKLVKMEDADELPHALVTSEAGQETYSQGRQDSSCLVTCEGGGEPLAVQHLGDINRAKAQEAESPPHSKPPGLIKWVMFQSQEGTFFREAQDRKEEKNENSAAAVSPEPSPRNVQNETSEQQPAPEGRVTRRAFRDALIHLSTKEKDVPEAEVKLVSLRHPSLVFSGEFHCNGVARMIMVKPGSALMSRSVAMRQDVGLVRPEDQTAAFEDQFEDITASHSLDSHEDDPCSSETESADETEIPKSPSTDTDLPMIASVFSLRGTEEEGLHPVEHQESEPREDIHSSSELPLITSVFTLSSTEEEALHPTKHQESQPRRDIKCNTGDPAVSLLIVGNVLQPLRTPLNTQKVDKLGAGQAAVSVMIVGDDQQPSARPPNAQESARVAELGAGDSSVQVLGPGDELQPVMPTPNSPEGERVSELPAGGTDPSVRIVLNQLKDLTSPTSTRKQKRSANPDAGLPMITSVFTLRDTEDEELHPLDNPESERSEDVTFDSGIPMITAVFTLRDEEEEELQPVDHRLAKRRENTAKRKESLAQDPGNSIPEGSRKMKYSTHYQVGPGPYTCPACGMIFERFTPFRKHQAKHKDLRLHKCTVCGDTFDRKFRLLDHKKTHAINPRKYMPFILPKPTI
ncbi:uncharacterized protein [Pleurodeles waltl]|uniref:uncharacterized protein isoform X2 n=1 Tax=Pleurodeles waltl TaxID=8319 RepID=UPI003709C039